MRVGRVRAEAPCRPPADDGAEMPRMAEAAIEAATSGPHGSGCSLRVVTISL